MHFSSSPVRAVCSTYRILFDFVTRIVGKYEGVLISP